MNARVSFERAQRVAVCFHEFAHVFPMLDGEAREAMRVDIKENGVSEVAA